METTADSLLATSESPASVSLFDAKKCTIYTLVVFGIFGGMVVLFGLVGNILTIIIMLKDKDKTTMGSLLTSLAIVDGASLLLGGAYDTYRGLFYFFDLKFYYRYLGIAFPLTYVPTRVLSQISSYLTVIIGIHRYLSICHPHQMKILCSPRRIQIYLTITVIVSFLCYVPSACATYEIEKLPNGVYPLHITAFHQSNINKVLVIFRYVLNFVIPLPCLTLMAFRIVRSLQASQTVKLSAKEKAKRSLSMSVLLVIVIFMVFKFPEGLFLLYSLVVPVYKYTNCPYAIFYIMYLPNICLAISAASNIIVYTLCLQGFRRKLISMLTFRKQSSSVAPSLGLSTRNTNTQQQTTTVLHV